MSVQNARIGDLATFLSGFAFKSAEFNSDKRGIPLIRIRDVTTGATQTYYTGKYDSRYLVNKGDYIIGMDGEFNLAQWRSEPALLNQRVCKIEEVSGHLDRDYLARYLAITLKQIEATTPFVTVKHLSVKSLNEIEIPLPPLQEQQKVARVLDIADTLRAKRRASIALLDDLTRSIFLDMFGKPSPIWPRTTVAGVAKNTAGSIRTGPFGSQLLHEEFTDEGISVIGIDNAVTNKFQWKSRRFITVEKYKKLTRFTVHPGDVLITIMGTCGRCVVVPDGIPTAINTKHLCCITLNREICLPEFLHSHFLAHPEARRYLSKTAKGAIMDGLNMTIIKELPITLPPIELQHTFVNRLEALKIAKAKHSSHLAELDALFASLQDRAFRGKLWDATAT